MGRLGVGQMCSTDDQNENFATVERLVDEALRQGVHLLSLPECFAFMGSPERPSKDAAEPLDGPLMRRYRDLAARREIWLALGGFHEVSGDRDGRIFNTHVVIDARGMQRAVYRKAHLFDVDAGASGSFRESATTRAGSRNGAVLHGTPVGTLGLTTCYDVRFPGQYEALRGAGAQVILVPSAFMCTTGEAHWEVLLRARAIEQQVYIGAAAQVGVHSSARSSYGHSLLVEPWGVVVADAGKSPECVVSMDIDVEQIAAIQTRMPVFDHRRLDICDVEVFR